MEIKIGKSYKTRGGWIATVDEKRGLGGFLVTHHGNGSDWYHLESGEISTSNRDFDIIGEA